MILLNSLSFNIWLHIFSLVLQLSILFLVDNYFSALIDIHVSPTHEPCIIFRIMNFPLKIGNIVGFLINEFIYLFIEVTRLRGNTYESFGVRLS